MFSFEQKYEIEEFLRREALLLEQNNFRPWLDLFTEDAMYIVPFAENVQGDVAPAGHPLVKDTKEMLEVRVVKDESGFSHVEIPRSMTTRILSNIVVDESSVEDAEVRLSFLVRQARKLRDVAWWAGMRKDQLRRVDGEWKIAHREVTLHTPVMPRGLTIFL